MILASAFLRQLQAPQFAVQPIFLLYGEEPLFLRDATSGLKQRLQAVGYQAGDTFEVDSNFDWQSLKMETQSASLFSDTRFIVLNMPKGSPGKEGAEFFQFWAKQSQPNPEVCLVVLCEKLDARQTKAKWMQAIESCGVVVQAKSVPTQEVPNWIHQRAQLNGLQLTPEAANLLAERTEGNLLAADQELIKLSLLLSDANQPAGQIAQVDAQQITERVVDQAHYQLFALSSSILTGRLENSLHRLQRLQQEGIEPPIILWLLTKELRVLLELQTLTGRMNFAQACKQLRIWSSQQAEYGQALKRASLSVLQQGLQQALQIDRKIKGIQPTTSDAEIWLGLSDLVIKMAK